MPPAQNTPLIPSQSGQGATGFVPAHKPQSSLPDRQAGIGPWIGTLIIIILLGFGALYFWGAYLNREKTVDTLPFIPADNSIPANQ